MKQQRTLEEARRVLAKYLGTDRVRRFSDDDKLRFDAYARVCDVDGPGEAHGHGFADRVYQVYKSTIEQGDWKSLGR